MDVPILEVIELHKRYGTQTALEGINLQVMPGERFGLLGPNGAGKTTLLSILSSLLESTSGEVRLAGRVLGPHDRELRRLVGIVPQDLALYAELTTRENLAFFGGLYGITGAALRQRVDVVLRDTGLQEDAEVRVANLSWGMKRCLNLAAAVVHEPRLLLLDEPTTGVDPRSREHIFEEVRRLNAAGVTIVYTSHYMEEVQALCPRIGIIDHGRLVACDTLSALLRTLHGRIRFHVPPTTAPLRPRLAAIPNARLLEPAENTLELECIDVRATLLQLVSALKDLGVPMTRLEMQEPNLERVFLHLTGRALRD
jgi:linearmycin/streptolysin S transport system ATP-binding protein